MQEVQNEYPKCYSHVSYVSHLQLRFLLAREQQIWRKKDRADLHNHAWNCCHDSFNCEANICVNEYDFSRASAFRLTIES